MAKAYGELAGMGICDLEIARIDFTRENAEKVKALKAELNVHPVSIQVKPKYVFGDPSAVVDFCRITGCKNVVISMLPFECILGSEEKFYAFAASLDAQYELYEKEGITLAYHHHNWEYVRLKNGKTRMQELLLATRKIKFVTDTYWSARSGVSPERQIREFGSRLLGIHLRDLAFEPKFIDVIARDAAIGDGVIDFAEVLKAAREVGCEYAVIEQNSKDPYADIARGYKNVLKIKSQIEEISIL